MILEWDKRRGEWGGEGKWYFLGFRFWVKMCINFKIETWKKYVLAIFYSNRNWQFLLHYCPLAEYLKFCEAIIFILYSPPSPPPPLHASRVCLQNLGVVHISISGARFSWYDVRDAIDSVCCPLYWATYHPLSSKRSHPSMSCLDSRSPAPTW